MGQERRQFIRVHARLTTLIKPLKTAKVRRALTKDISGIGVCLVTEELCELGTPLEVEMRLPDYDAPVKFLGQVMWSKPIGEPRKGQPPTAEIGLRVVSIDPKDRSLLMQYAKLNAPRTP